MLLARPRLRTAVAAIAAAWLLFGIAGAHCGIPRLAFHSADQSRSIVLTADHAQLDVSSAPCPAKLATPASPHAVIVLAALGVAVLIGVVAASVAWPVAPSGRSPPGGPPFSLFGRDLLSRFCLARR